MFASSSLEGAAILCIDANTHPEREQDQTAWKALRSIPGAKCVWDQWYDQFGQQKRDQFGEQQKLPISTNKMRGPLSEHARTRATDHGPLTTDHGPLTACQVH